MTLIPSLKEGLTQEQRDMADKLTEADITAIVAGLTEPQRLLLIEGLSCVRSHRPGSKLITLGLWHDGGDDYVIRACRTPLGDAVRQYLLSGAPS